MLFPITVRNFHSSLSNFAPLSHQKDGASVSGQHGLSPSDPTLTATDGKMLALMLQASRSKGPVHFISFHSPSWLKFCGNGQLLKSVKHVLIFVLRFFPPPHSKQCFPRIKRIPRALHLKPRVRNECNFLPFDSNSGFVRSIGFIFIPI